ncbi:MAG: hypothetical protein GTO41_20610 [Burkholderiales bacterium]|nr:hypothetical protein [Burkholderiales bacterium]
MSNHTPDTVLRLHLETTVSNQAIHIAPAATCDRPPEWPVAELQHAMVGIEIYEAASGEAEKLGHRRGPDGSAHRNDVILDKHP